MTERDREIESRVAMTDAVARDAYETGDLTHLHLIILLPTQSNTHADETHAATRDPLAATAAHGDPSHSQLFTLITETENLCL